MLNGKEKLLSFGIQSNKLMVIAFRAAEMSFKRHNQDSLEKYKYEIIIANHMILNVIAFGIFFFCAWMSLLFVCVASEMDRYKAMRTWRTVDTK